MVINQGAIGQGLLGSGVLTGSQNAAMQSAAYNNMMQNAQTAKTTSWGDSEGTRVSVSINVERASNGYIIRADGLSTVATTLEELQQHVTAIVVSNLVLDGVK
jgi:hypothetical protein